MTTNRLANICAETVGPPGTGSISVGGATLGPGRAFSLQFTNGQSVYYMLLNGTQLEIGIGTYTSNTIGRTTILWNTDGTTTPINMTTTGTCICEVFGRYQMALDDNLLMTEANHPPYLVDLAKIQTTNPFFSYMHLWDMTFDAAPSNNVGTIGGLPVTQFLIPHDGFYHIEFMGRLVSETGQSSYEYQAGISADGLPLVHESVMAPGRVVTSLYLGGTFNLDFVGFFSTGQIITAGTASNTFDNLFPGTKADVGHLAGLGTPDGNAPTGMTGANWINGWPAKFQITQLSY